MPNTTKEVLNNLLASLNAVKNNDILVKDYSVKRTDN